MSPKERLEQLKKQFNPASALTGALAGLTPMIEPVIKKMEKPKSEGGLLEDGQDKISIMVLLADGKLKVNIVPLKQNKETGVVELCAPLQTDNVKDVIGK